MGARRGDRNGGRGAGGHAPDRASWHFRRAWPQASRGAAQPLTSFYGARKHENFVTGRKYGFAPIWRRLPFRTRFWPHQFRLGPDTSPGLAPEHNRGNSMSDLDRNYTAARTGYRADQVAIDAGLRAYMIRVYNYMAAGVALTGVVAWFTFSAAVV